MKAFISPHRPDEIYGIPLEKLREGPGYWVIDPEDYKEALLQRWDSIVFLEPSESFPLRWKLTISGSVEDGGYFRLADNTVSFDLYDTFEEFVFWHRSLVPEEKRLYFFLEHTLDVLEVKASISGEELKRFAGMV